MGSGAVIYVPSFMKMGSGVLKLMGGGAIQTHTHGQQRDLISLLYFFKIRKVGKVD
jgi:high-affinity Fe2+/Pb2+ permease